MRPLTSPRPLADSLIGLFLSFLIFAGFAFGQSVVDVAWDPCPETDIAGYEVLFGTISGTYSQILDSGLSTEAALSGLTPGATYFCAVRAYNTSSLFSPLSEEISFIAPGPPALEISLGQATNPPLVVGNSMLDLGEVFLQSRSAEHDITVRNPGATTLENLAIAVAGQDAAEFKITPAVFPSITADGSEARFSLPPGASITFSVSFQPLSLGSKSARLLVSSSISDPSPFDLALTATAINIPDTGGTSIILIPASRPEIAIQQAGGSELADDHSILRLGSSLIGNTSAPETLLIRNTGTGILTDLSISADGMHSSEFVIDDLKTTVLAPGETTSFQVRFKPASAGEKSATLHLASNDADEGSFEIPLTCTGFAAPEIAIGIKGGSPLTDEKTFINFGYLALGKSGKTRILTITNQGTAPLTGLKLTKNGLHSADFSAGNLQKTTLAPGASTTFKVTFKPTAGGIRWGAIHIASNDADEGSFDMTLTGKSVSAAQQPREFLAQSVLPLPQESTVTRGVTVIDGKKFRTLTITSSARTGAPDAVVEVSSDLLDWFSGKKHTTVLLSNSTTLKVRDNIPVSDGEKRYIRLKP